MSNIYGFLDTRNADRFDSKDLIDTMRDRLGHSAGECLQSGHMTSGYALGCQRHSGSLHTEAELLIAVTGRPRWSDRSLQSIASEKGNAQAAVEAYRNLGTGLLQHLHGSFSLAILEPRTEHALIAVDRLGTHPLAFSAVNNALVFASRADAIRAHPGMATDLDAQGLFNYLYFHMVPSPGSIYRDIGKLLPGEYLTYDAGSLQRSFYWQLEYREPEAQEDQLSRELLSLLEKSVGNCLTDEATGAFLSGGLDSSTVTGMLARLSSKKADAYGIGFDASGYDEMDFARASARHFNVKLHEYYVTPEDVIDAIPKIAAAYDEPFGNASAIPAYYCARLARQDGMSCLLAGDGGDEIFAGNERYARQKLFEHYQRVPALLRSGLIEPLFLGAPLTQHLPLLRKMRSYIEQARLGMPERMETYNFLHRTPLGEIFEPGFLSQVDAEAPLNNIKAAYDRPDTDSMLKRMLHMDLKITLADNDLRKVNRMCEIAGIEVRYPMLDEDLVEFSARVPSGMLIRGQQLRSFYRHAVKDFLAPETLNKSKQGFGLPFGVWMVEHVGLRELAYDSLESFKQRGYLRHDYIDYLLNEHRTGHAGYYGVMIWVIMMLEQWLTAHEQ
jgi:asparagine synthase (glutamine-hydrolysing)